MRAGSRVLCLTLLGLACGRAEEGPGGASSGGAGASSNGGAIQSGGRVASAGSSSGGVAVADGGAPQATGGQTPRAGGADSGGQGGASLPTGGSQSSSGGSPSAGGSTASSGMGGVAAGNGGASVGGAGAAGEGGAVSCEDYVACGCGCCATTTPSPPSLCYYPDVAGDLEAIVAADQAASQSPTCASAGCSLGTQYTCCKGLSPDSTPATYSTTLTIGAYDRVHVTKEGTPSCARIVLLMPGNTPSRVHTALELPTGWQLDMAFHGVCSLGSAVNTWIGASGSVKLKPQGSGCAFDVHLTAFFTEQGAVTPVRFDVEGLAVDGLSPLMCD